MTKKECHLELGHGGAFEFFSPTVHADATIVLADPKQFKAVAAAAKVHRKSEL